MNGLETVGYDDRPLAYTVRLGEPLYPSPHGLPRLMSLT